MQVKLELLGDKEAELETGLAAGETTFPVKTKVKIHLVDLRFAYYIVKYRLCQ